MKSRSFLATLAGLVTIATVVIPMLDKDPTTGPPAVVGYIIIAAGALVTLLALSGSKLGGLLGVLLLAALAVNLVVVLLTMNDLDTTAKSILGGSLVLDLLGIIGLIRAQRH